MMIALLSVENKSLAGWVSKFPNGLIRAPENGIIRMINLLLRHALLTRTAYRGLIYTGDSVGILGA
jgi:hypothetical protein